MTLNNNADHFQLPSSIALSDNSSIAGDTYPVDVPNRSPLFRSSWDSTPPSTDFESLPIGQRYHTCFINHSHLNDTLSYTYTVGISVHLKKTSVISVYHLHYLQKFLYLPILT